MPCVWVASPGSSASLGVLGLRVAGRASVAFRGRCPSGLACLGCVRALGGVFVCGARGRRARASSRLFRGLGRRAPRLCLCGVFGACVRRDCKAPMPGLAGASVGGRVRRGRAARADGAGRCRRAPRGRTRPHRPRPPTAPRGWAPGGSCIYKVGACACTAIPSRAGHAWAHANATSRPPAARGRAARRARTHARRATPTQRSRDTPRARHATCRSTSVQRTVKKSAMRITSITHDNRCLSNLQ